MTTRRTQHRDIYDEPEVLPTPPQKRNQSRPSKAKTSPTRGLKQEHIDYLSNILDGINAISTRLDRMDTKLQELEAGQKSILKMMPMIHGGVNSSGLQKSTRNPLQVFEK